MRTTADRIRHTFGFELLGLAIILSFFALFMQTPVEKIGALTVAFSLIAAIWNFYYNRLFDHFMLKLTRQIHKKAKHRIIHAVVFEVGLMWITLPVIAWWLGISLIEAFLMDAGFVLFYLVYTYYYNLAYDKIFPIPASE